MSNGYAHEVLDEAAYDEAAYDEGWGDDAYEPEARGRGRGRPAPAPPRSGYVPPPQPTGQFVNQLEFQKSLNAVREDMQKNARAITAVGSQVDALGTRVRREVVRTRDESQNTTQMLALLPLLTQKSLTVTQDITSTDSEGNETTQIPQGTKLSEPADGIAAILPLLLISGGLGGSSSSGGSMGGNNMLLLVLALTFLNK
jgi:hypothetical protein